MQAIMKTIYTLFKRDITPESVRKMIQDDNQSALTENWFYQAHDKLNSKLKG